jgi:ectoine hydroxylase-related dioxygenase (phytanoyl-CoA dioxygenase family)
VITRRGGYLALSDAAVPAESEQLERDGYAVLRGLISGDDLVALRDEVDGVYRDCPPEVRQSKYPAAHWEPFRYGLLNHSPLAQLAIAHPRTLAVVEPLLGEDCHVIANTVWRQPPDENSHGGRFWHIDSGPHVPRPPDVAWDDRIPYPIFAIATHLLLIDCPLESGPTGVIPRSHRSGQSPPRDRMDDDGLEWQGAAPIPLVGAAGDLLLFVSDAWHRRLPSAPGDPGRYFIQCHYGRRDLAQRIQPTSVVNHLSPAAVARATTGRDHTLVGLHRPFFYDG